MEVNEQRIQEAEQRLFARCGMQPVAHFVQLEEPAIRIRVLEVGTGAPVLLLHPGTWFAAHWALLLPHVPGFRLLCLDFPGHGLSDGVDYRTQDPRRHTVALMRGLLARLGLRSVAVVGNSLGGMAALWLAIDAPELVTVVVVLGLPGSVLPGSRPDLAIALLSIPGLNRLLLRLPSSVDRARARLTAPLGRAAKHGIPEEMFEIHYLASRRAAFATTLSTFMQTTLRWRSPRPGIVLSDSEISGISQPVHFIWGDEDIYGSPAIGEHAANLMSRASLEVYRGGHFPQLDAPAACGKSIVNFLSHCDVSVSHKANTIG